MRSRNGKEGSNAENEAEGSNNEVERTREEISEEDPAQEDQAQEGSAQEDPADGNKTNGRTKSLILNGRTVQKIAKTDIKSESYRNPTLNGRMSLTLNSKTRATIDHQSSSSNTRIDHKSKGITNPTNTRIDHKSKGIISPILNGKTINTQLSTGNTRIDHKSKGTTSLILNGRTIKT